MNWTRLLGDSKGEENERGKITNERGPKTEPREPPKEGFFCNMNKEVAGIIYLTNAVDWKSMKNHETLKS